MNTASLAALIPGASAYSVSKHGVLTLTEGLYFHCVIVGRGSGRRCCVRGS